MHEPLCIINNNKTICLYVPLVNSFRFLVNQKKERDAATVAEAVVSNITSLTAEHPTVY